jgi:hypothetical protein
MVGYRESGSLILGPTLRSFLHSVFFSPMVQSGDVSLFDLNYGIDADAGNEPANELAGIQEYEPTLTFKAHAGSPIQLISCMESDTGPLRQMQ